jgi:two-component system cell cycle sensor histidine kinase/response regulator CckA
MAQQRWNEGMSRRLHPAADGRRSGAQALPVLLALALLLIIGLAFAPDMIPLSAEIVALAPLAAAVAAGILVTVIGYRLLRRRDGGFAFDAIFAGSDTLAALSDSDGTLLRLNPPLAAMADAGCALVSDILYPFAADAGAVSYRLALAARRHGLGQEVVTGGVNPMRVTARAVTGDRLLWLIEPAPKPVPALPAFVEGAMRDASGRPVNVTLDHQTTGKATDALIESLPVAIARLSPEGAIVFANAAARALLGSAAQPGIAIGTLVEGLGRSMETRIAEALRGDGTGRAEIARAEPDGREVFLQVSLTRLTLDGEAAVIAVLADATELKTLELIFVQSQKMQAIGQFAGGVAHDFNNLLTAISGHTDLLLHRHNVGDNDYADLVQVRQNANRAAALVRQLLAFSRKQTLRPRVVNLPDVLGEVSHLLNRLLGERVTLRIENAPDLHLVKVDERQFEQVVMNLVVNARDAMSEGGTVCIRCYNCRVEVETRRGRAVMPRGDYVRIDVVDTGVGIPADALDKIFEPFYTTKKTGEGTGLGLSTVYGIIKQTGGYIFAESVVGEGTTFSIYLPRHVPTATEVAPAPREPEPAEDHTGRGVVLLIEDEAPVRAFAARALKMRGYEVLEAASAEEALDLLDDPSLSVDVLVSDVVMPGMDGPTCVRKAREQRPDVKVVFVSGYAEEALQRSMAGLENCTFLPKPFSLNELTAKVKECVTAT